MYFNCSLFNWHIQKLAFSDACEGTCWNALFSHNFYCSTFVNHFCRFNPHTLHNCQTCIKTGMSAFRVPLIFILQLDILCHGCELCEHLNQVSGLEFLDIFKAGFDDSKNVLGPEIACAIFLQPITSSRNFRYIIWGTFGVCGLIWHGSCQLFCLPFGKLFPWKW